MSIEKSCPPSISAAEPKRHQSETNEELMCSIRFDLAVDAVQVGGCKRMDACFKETEHLLQVKETCDYIPRNRLRMRILKDESQNVAYEGRKK